MSSPNPIPDADIDNPLEGLQEPGCLVVAAIARCLEVQTEIRDEFRVNRLDRDVAGAVLPFQKLPNVVERRGVFLAGSAGSFLADQLAHPFEMIAIQESVSPG